MQFSTSSFFSLLLVILSFSSSAEDWSLVKESDGIQLYARKQASGLFEIKASTYVSAPPKAFINLLMDTDSGPQWIDNAVSVEVLSSPTPHIMIVQTLLNAPWPLKNRDMVTQSETTYDQQSGVISLTITDKSNYVPESPSRMRMKNIMGTWTLKPNQNGTEITYQGSGEAGGIIPTWLSNRVLVNSTFKSFENMRQKIKETKYQ